MAGKKRRGRRTKARKRGGANGGGVVQRLLVGLSVVVLVLCAASITYSFFMRGGSPDEPPRPLRLRVLNGVGEPGLANEAARALKLKGVDVLDTDNAPAFDYEQSVLIARRHTTDAESLARELGCSKVIVQIDETRIEDATLILGEDYRALKLDWDN
jgi:hypothetical protein